MTMIYVLLVFAHVGMLGEGNSNSVTTQEFSNLANCEQAKKAFESMSSGSTKVIKATCVKK